MGRHRECAAEQVRPGGAVQRHDGGTNEDDRREAPTDRGKRPEHRARVVDHEQPAGERETERHADEDADRQDRLGSQFACSLARPQQRSAIVRNNAGSWWWGLAHRLAPEHGYQPVLTRNGRDRAGATLRNEPGRT